MCVCVWGGGGVRGGGGGGPRLKYDKMRPFKDEVGRHVALHGRHAK